MTDFNTGDEPANKVEAVQDQSVHNTVVQNGNDSPTTTNSIAEQDKLAQEVNECGETMNREVEQEPIGQQKPSEHEDDSDVSSASGTDDGRDKGQTEEQADSKVQDEGPESNARSDGGRGAQGGFNTQGTQPAGGYQVPLYASPQQQYTGEAYGGRGPAAYAVPETLPAKAGPSPATIGLGVVMLLIGAAMLALGVWLSCIGASADLRIILAFLLAAIGVILLIVAMACVIVQAVRGRKRHKAVGADSAASGSVKQ